MERLRSFRLVASVEEHSVCGGLGGALAERFALSGPPHLILGARDEFCRAGEYEVLLEAYGLTAPHISSRVIETFKEICQ